MTQTAVRALCLLLPLTVGGCAPPAAHYQRALATAADEVARLAKARGVETLAVVDLAPADDRTTHLGRYLADALSGELGAAGRDLGFTLCDRDGWGPLLAEQRRAASGLVDRQQVREIGRFCGTEVVVSGRYWLLGERLEARFDLLDAERAVQLGSVELNVPLSAALRDLDAPAERRRTARPAAAPGFDTHLPQTAAAGPFSLTLLHCRFTGDDLFCRLKVRNDTTGVRRVELGGASRLIDNGGDVYRPSQLTIGGETLDLDDGDETLPYLLPANAAVNAELVFHTVRRREKKAQVLAVDLGGDGRAEFRGFFFSRD